MELVEGAAAQHIIVWAADQSVIESVEWQLPNRIQFIRAANRSAMELVEGAAAPQIIGQPLEGAAAQQDTIH